MTGDPHETSSKNSSSSRQQSIAAIYWKYGKCEYIKDSASVGNNDMQSYNKKDFNNVVYLHDHAPRLLSGAKGQKLTGVTSVAKTKPCSHASHL
jgi:hypothetical protein